MNAKAIQYPVGQGGLYRCRVWCPAYVKPIHFVYDCGSLSQQHFLHSSIDRLKMEIGENSLEFLVLSHFDADHVNGLDYLLDGTLKVNTVFLPYLTPMQRIMVAARNPDAAESYYEFLVDPATFLFERGIDKIVFVVGGGDSQNQEPPFDDGMPSDDPRRSDFLKFTSGPNIEDITDENSEKLHASGTLSHGDKVRVGSCWQLKFFNYDSFPDGYRTIHDRASVNLMNGDPEKLQRWKKFVSAVLEATGLAELESDKILKSLSYPEIRGKIKDAYKVIKNDHNNVSLALWHGPAYRQNRATVCYWGDRTRDIHRKHQYHGWWPNTGGTLLTGDLNLNHDFDQFAHHYQGLIQETAFFQVPHHGSTHSWDSRVLGLISDRALCFTSSGFSNKFGHPHLDVIDDILPGNPWADGHERSEVHFKIGDSL